jgi:hypothetical protein
MMANQRPNRGAGCSGPRYADPAQATENRPPRRDADVQHRERKVEHSAASKTLRRGRAEAHSADGRQPAQVLQ